MANKTIKSEENRVYWAFLVALIIFIAAYIVTRGKYNANLPALSAISAVLVSIPSIYALIKTKGRNNGLLIYLSLSVYCILVTYLAVKTHVLFGRVVYTAIAGNTVGHSIPWTVIFIYPPILLLSFWLAIRTSRSPINLAESKKSISRTDLRVALKTSLFAALVAIVMDTAAIRVNFWHWDAPKLLRFFKVPSVDFIGWLFAAFIGGLILSMLYRNFKAVKSSVALPASLAYSGIAILWFWTSVNNWSGNLIPGLIGLFFTYLFGYFIFIRTTEAK